MEEQIPSFPIYVTLPVCGATLLLVLVQVWQLRDSVPRSCFWRRGFAIALRSFTSIHLRPS